jgi:HK97 family phage major capsid protein
MFVQLKKDYLGQKAGARIDVDQPVAEALLKGEIAEPVRDDVIGKAIAEHVEKTVGALTKTLSETLDATLKEFAAAAARSRKNAVPAIFGSSGGGDPQKTFGAFLLAVRRGDARALEEMGSHFNDWSESKAALNTATGGGAQGGFTVPTDFLPRLLQQAAESAIVRPRATVIPMTSRSIQVPALDVVTAPTAGDNTLLGARSRLAR